MAQVPGAETSPFKLWNNPVAISDKNSRLLTHLLNNICVLRTEVQPNRWEGRETQL